MATFKVGQRVRIIRSVTGKSLGREAAIVEFRPDARFDCGITDAYVLQISGLHGIYAVPVSEAGQWLAPLTDPKADAFLESLKKLGREPKPLEVVETLSQRSPLVWSDK